MYLDDVDTGFVFGVYNRGNGSANRFTGKMNEYMEWEPKGFEGFVKLMFKVRSLNFSNINNRLCKVERFKE